MRMLALLSPRARARLAGFCQAMEASELFMNRALLGTLRRDVAHKRLFARFGTLRPAR